MGRILSASLIDSVPISISCRSEKKFGPVLTVLTGCWAMPRSREPARMKLEKFDIHILVSNLTWKDLRAATLAAAGAVREADVPAMPSADDFARLHHAFT